MGCICTKMSAKRYHMNEDKFNKLVQVCERFGLSRSLVDDFFGIYAKIDIGLTGKISLREFLEFFDLEVTPFSRRTFGVLDTDKSGDIDFFEFVVNLYSYCTYDWAGLVKYAFDLFDESADGSLDLDEVRALVKFLYGKTLDKKVEIIIRKMDDDGNGTISFPEFCQKARNFPLLLFPAFYMQDMMRKKCLGIGFWEKHTYRVRQSQKYGLDNDENMLEVLKDIIFERKKAEAAAGKKGKAGGATNGKGGKGAKTIDVKGKKGKKGAKGASSNMAQFSENFADLEEMNEVRANVAAQLGKKKGDKGQRGSVEGKGKPKRKSGKGAADARAGRHGRNSAGKKVVPGNR